MRAFITLDPLRRTYDVRFARSGPIGQMAVATGIDEQGFVTWDVQAERDPVDPFLRLDPEMLEALVREATGVFPATEPTARHLDDAIKVRDALLEHVLTGRTFDPRRGV